MTNVAAVDRQHGRDWPYTVEQMQQIKVAVQVQPYPPAGRSGIGTVLRQGRG
jgi:hypothetical protein